MADSEIRVGKISSINYESGMARVTYRDKDGCVTQEFPILTNNDEYRMPQAGQEVIVAHMSNGSSRGAIIGTIWNRKNEPKEAGEKLYRKDFSREKDAAYERYSDETGEYLVKAANVHINGVEKAVLDGPELEIAANISILIQSEQIHVDMEGLTVTGGEEGEVSASIKADVKISQEENKLEAVLLKMAMELLEGLEIKAGTDVKEEAEGAIEIRAGTQMKVSGKAGVEISTGEGIRMRDGKYDVTLEEIMERLEALEGG